MSKSLKTENEAGGRPVSQAPVTVAHVVQNLNVGGLERIVISLINHTDDRRFRTLLYCLGDGGSLVGEVQCPVEALDKKEGFAYSLPWRLSRSFRRYGVEVVHCHNFAPLVYGAIGGRIARVDGVIYTAHGAKTAARAKQAWLDRFRLVDRLITVSDDARRTAIEEAGIAADRIETIINGVDLAPFDVPLDVAEKKRSLGLDGGVPLFGIVARLTRAKDHATLFEAFARLRKECSAKLVVVGVGELEEELHERVNALALTDDVVFTGSRNDVSELLRVFDVFVLSSYTEGLSVTLLEAMAAGLPIIATHVGGNTEVVTQDQTGIVVPARDAEALARAMVRLHADETTRQRMGKAGKARVRELFSVETMVRRYESIYETVARRGGN